LNHWQFAFLLCDLECDYEGILYYAEIHWLSCHKLLRSLFDLRNEIILFLDMKEQDVSGIKSTNWIIDLEFTCDITKHLVN
jgi:hypothetical protein